jgi:hypothetical protein
MIKKRSNKRGAFSLGIYRKKEKENPLIFRRKGRGKRINISIFLSPTLKQVLF